MWWLFTGGGEGLFEPERPKKNQKIGPNLAKFFWPFFWAKHREKQGLQKVKVGDL